LDKITLEVVRGVW